VQLEDKLLETEFNLSVSQQQRNVEQSVAQENAQLREMLSETRRLHAIALDKCRQSEQEAERAQHTIRLHVERENELRDELVETKKALDKSRSSEALLRQQLREANASELAAKKKLTLESGVGKARGRGGYLDSGGGGLQEPEIAASVNPDGMGNLAHPGFDSDGSDEAYPFTPKHGKTPCRQVSETVTDFASETLGDWFSFLWVGTHGTKQRGSQKNETGVRSAVYLLSAFARVAFVS